MMSTRFINECKNGANCNRLGKICVETNKIATGNNLGLSNTIDQVVSKLKIKGYTKQNSYSGKNLFFNSDTFNDVNIQGNIDTENTLDGSYSIMTDKAWQGPYLDLKSITEKNHLKVGDRVTYSVYFKTNFIPTKDMKFAFYRAIAWEENVPRKTIEQASVIPNKWQRLSFTIELTEYSLTALIARIEAEYYTDSSDYSFGNNHENKIWFACPQFEKDETATNYEPYVGGTPSPNPDYPQEIEVGKGKNLFDLDYITYDSNCILNNDKTITYKGWANVFVDNKNVLKMLKPNTTYTIGFNAKVIEKSSNITERQNLLTLHKSNNPHIYLSNLNINSMNVGQVYHSVFTFTTPSDLTDYRILSYTSYPSPYSLIQLSDIMLVEGSNEITYEPYNSIVCKSTGKNLFDINNIFAVFPSTSLNYQIEKNKITLTAIGDKGAQYVVYQFNDVDETKNYTVSFKGKKIVKGIDGIPSVYLRVFVSDDGEIYKSFKTTGTTTINENEEYNFQLTLSGYKYYSLYFYNNNSTPVTIGETTEYYDIQIEEGEIVTEYEPYKESKIAYHLGENFLADKDYIENGKFHKNVGKVVFDGTESEWSIGAETTDGLHYRFSNSLFNDSTFYKVGSSYMSDKFKSISNESGLNITEEGIYNTNNTTANRLFISINKSRLSDNSKESFQNWLSEHPVEVYYELEEEQVIDLETEGILELYSPETNLSNNIDSEMEIKYTNYETEITNSDNLSSFTVDDTCYVDGKIIGTNYIKKVQSQLVAVPNDVDLIDKKVFVKTGVKYDDLSTEWLDMGKYTIERPEDEQTANLTQITAYDDFTLLDKPYVCNLDFDDPVYVSDFYLDVCKQLGLVPETTEFLNSDIQINANPFVNNETLRIVLQEIEKVSCSYGEIDLETNKIKLSWLNQSETPDYEFKTSDYTTLEGGKIIYGPVNCLVIKESQIEGENTVRQDEQSIAKDGETQIAIEDSYFLFTQALREQAIDNIWNRVKGLTYVDCKITTSYGKPFLKKGMKIRINVNDGRVFDTYVLKHTFTYDGSYQSVIESPALTKQETKIKSQSISETIRLTQIEVDKAKGTITANAKKTQDIEDGLNNNYYSKTTVNEMLMNSENGVTNTFSEAGGNNVFRNTGLWFTETKTHTEKQTSNILRNMTYFNCKKNYDGPTYPDYTVDYTFKIVEELGTGMFISDLNKLINIEQSSTYKYTNLISGLSRYDLTIFELDKDKKLIPSIIEPEIAKRIEISKYAIDEPLNFDSKTKYIVLFGGLNDEGTSEPLEEIQEKIKDLQILETKNVEIGEEVYEFWEGNVLRKSNDEAANNNSLLLKKGTLKQEQEVPNGNYSISFYYKKLIEQANVSVLINDIEYSLDSLETKQFYTGETDVESGEIITQPIIVTTNHIKIEFKSDTNNAAEVWDLMCNKGTVKLAWSQNQNETTTETVNISKGITITSTNMETIFKANANGIKILTLQKATIAYFTDKGLSTNELIVNNKAQICGTLINEVEEQTWLTRM